MSSRITDFLIVSTWLVAMAWLTARDVVPRWFAAEPPEAANLSWLDRHGKAFQYGIFGENGVRCGTAWSTYQVGGESMTRTDTMVLAGVPLTPELIVQSKMDFLKENELDEIEVKIIGVPAPIRLAGERQGPKFAFRLTFDRVPVHEFVLESEAAETLSDTIRPFSALQGLQVGQSWTVHVIDPFSLIQGPRQRLKPVLVTVARREKLRFQGRDQECFVVETEGATAWVADDGRVLQQRVEVPGLGAIAVQEEPFQQSKLDEVSRKFHGYGLPGKLGDSPS